MISQILEKIMKEVFKDSNLTDKDKELIGGITKKWGDLLGQIKKNIAAGVEQIQDESQKKRISQTLEIIYIELIKECSCT